MAMTTDERKKLAEKLKNHNWWKIDKELPDPKDRAEFLWTSVRDGIIKDRNVAWYLAQNIGPDANVKVAFDFITNREDREWDRFIEIRGVDSSDAEIIEAIAQLDADGVKNFTFKYTQLNDLKNIILKKLNLIDELDEQAIRILARGWLATEWEDDFLRFIDSQYSEDEWQKIALQTVTHTDVEKIAWYRAKSLIPQATTEQKIAMIARDQSQHTFHHALETLGALSPDALPTIEAEIKWLEKLEKYENEHQPRRNALRLASVSILSRAGQKIPKDYESPLEEILNTYTSNPLPELVEAIQALDPERADQLILKCLKKGTLGSFVDTAFAASKSSKVVKAAITHAGKFGKHQSIDGISKALGSLGEVAIDPLSKALSAKPPAIPGQIYVQALGYIKSPKSAEALVIALGASSKPIREAAEKALASLGAMAKEALDQGAKAKKKAVREASVRLLESLTNKDDSPLGEAADKLAALDRGPIDDVLNTLNTKESHSSADYELFDPLIEKHGNPIFLVIRDWFLEKPSDWHHQNVFSGFIRHYKSDPLTPWVAADGMARAPKLRKWEKHDLLYALEDLEKSAVKPFEYVLSQSTPALAEDMYEHLLKHSKLPATKTLINGLKSSSKGARKYAVEGLIRHGEAIIDDMVGLIGSKKKDTRLGAALVLAKVPAPKAQKKIKDALDKEKNDEVATALESALKNAGGSTAAAPGASSEKLDEKSVIGVLESQKVRKLPAFLKIDTLPVVKLKDGTKLSKEAKIGLISRLMKEDPKNQDDLARQIRPLLDDDSANAFSIAIKDAWASSGSQSKFKWAVYQQAILANEDRLNVFAPRLDSLASAGSHHLAKWYVDVLLRHGSRTGLSWILHWSKAAVRKSVLESARANLKLAAAEANLSEEALSATLNNFISDDVADRQVPTLGFENGPIDVDYGERKFQIRIDQNSELVIQDTESLKISKTLPKPRKNEKPSMDPKAVTPIKRQLSSAVKALSNRLEEGMIAGRTWSLDAFKELFLSHPVVTPFAARLVFRSSDGTLFTVSEDQLVDTEWDEVKIPKEATITLVHRLELDEKDVAKWGHFFAESEIIQPFKQLDRPIYNLKDHPFPQKTLGTILRGTLFGRLRRLGWINGMAEDAGIVHEAFRLLAGRGIRAGLYHGGFYVGDPGWDADEEIDVDSVWFSNTEGKKITPKDLDAIVFSEIRYDIERLLEK